MQPEIFTLSTLARDLLVWLSILWEKYPSRSWQEFLHDVRFVDGDCLLVSGWRHRVPLDLPFKQWASERDDQQQWPYHYEQYDVRGRGRRGGVRDERLT